MLILYYFRDLQIGQAFIFKIRMSFSLLIISDKYFFFKIFSPFFQPFRILPVIISNVTKNTYEKH
jgi:hypothetical protein